MFSLHLLCSNEIFFGFTMLPPPPPLSRPLYASASVPFFLLFRTCGYASAFVPSLLRSYCLVFVASSILLYSRGFGCGSDCKYFLVLLKGEGAVTFGFLWWVHNYVFGATLALWSCLFPGSRFLQRY
ncbi:uncharacterized protein EI90DRAFT_550142 [Cantharellus anzutake]|uniref:uncharacterized protein n=1 Tax=Cantharellus anzutake TaxID=1750568 RepID=UPI00190842A2|nr:uncharacterized protein EI90DRAFT_550142 [Cantharellus anzutake]KAF8313538.1 hypothetical protein EI90DRAFT_550142 [Cantharellus anzutake]